MSSPRDIDLHVSILYTGVSEQIVFTEELPTSITLIVRDNGQELRKITHQDLQISINLMPYLSEEKGVVSLSTDILRPRLQDILLGSTTIQQITPEIIESAYYVQKMKTVPVHVQSQISAAPQHQLVGKGEVTPTHVQVFGNQYDIDRIEYILTDSIRITDLRDAISLSAPLLVPSGIRVHPRSVQVEWQAEQFTEKSFILSLQTIGTPEGKQMRLFPQQVNVTVRVGISHFAEVQETDFQAFCHYPTEQVDALPIEVTTTNPHISNIRFSPSSVEYLINSEQ